MKIAKVLKTAFFVRRLWWLLLEVYIHSSDERRMQTVKGKKMDGLEVLSILRQRRCCRKVNSVYPPPHLLRLLPNTKKKRGGAGEGLTGSRF